MSRIQNIMKSLLPDMFFAKIEEESRNWFMECDTCGYSISYWDAGGLRAYASGKKRIFGRCPNCRKFKWFRVTKKQ